MEDTYAGMGMVEGDDRRDRARLVFTFSNKLNIGGRCFTAIALKFKVLEEVFFFYRKY